MQAYKLNGWFSKEETQQPMNSLKKNCSIST